MAEKFRPTPITVDPLELAEIHRIVTELIDIAYYCSLEAVRSTLTYLKAYDNGRVHLESWNRTHNPLYTNPKESTSE